ncbi:MAG: DNA polymerase/3'-5' exonuclease PolX [Acidobacteriota bacterium]
MVPMNKARVAAVLDEIGTLLEIKGENVFKSRAYHNASRIVAGLSGDIQEIVSSGQIHHTKGIGEGLSEKIIELTESGRLPYYDELKASIPPGVLDLIKIPGVGPKKVQLLNEVLKIRSIDELEKACRENRLGDVEGFGKKTQANILAGIEQVKKNSAKFLYSVAEAAARRILDRILEEKGVLHAEIGGSIRRRREVIGDIDILVSAKKKDAARILEAFTSHETVERIIGVGETKASVVLDVGINCDVRVVEPSEYPFALVYFTGNKEHNIRLRNMARAEGLTLNEYGFSVIGAEQTRGRAKKEVKAQSEADIYRHFGLEYIPPELREENGEFEAAAGKNIPRLIEEKDLRGTFHCHTNYSDGANTVQEMADAARALGWEYIGLADHSKAAAYANGLNEARVKKQHKEIDLLNQKYDGFRIFKGIEVDILANGDLDFSDAVLSTFDYVVASVHSGFKMPEAEMTRRILKAVKNKYVTMIGHLTGRLLLMREGYAVNQQEIIDAAADTGTIIEINAHPTRLDLDWRLCRDAKEKGMMFAINPDAHVTDGLRDVRYGVGVARKGWLEPKNVLNASSLREVEHYLKL